MGHRRSARSDLVEDALDFSGGSARVVSVVNVVWCSQERCLMVSLNAFACAHGADLQSRASSHLCRLLLNPQRSYAGRNLIRCGGRSVRPIPINPFLYPLPSPKSRVLRRGLSMGIYKSELPNDNHSSGPVDAVRPKLTQELFMIGIHPITELSTVPTSRCEKITYFCVGSQLHHHAISALAMIVLESVKKTPTRIRGPSGDRSDMSNEESCYRPRHPWCAK